MMSLLKTSEDIDLIELDDTATQEEMMLKNKLALLVMAVGLMFSGTAVAQSASDNEILLDLQVIH